ncbi:group XIIB secretory phospholipase A2-like protein [Portunus trituberculatus]|uniref:group XIIB secretory phospholipase A2-like protein n=1 Tax=Portunus trituberculatus TaxID=210409 RepID=UPI001E1CDA53|nr:group XIIB secretory phospholipase A2-like protein [Portunus trituberculatus]XP_045124168.1 group XIIB secretory phospholipase A2-like protein [Portunus trituberculatus]XP_045124177.1 group XIIB secretory phospholipase A2-like protein [Portunus trituberculatus]XP_045124185.1 group XIIB secretory phospholipase A2-like protein [Portunus trituberculatus]
MKQLAVAVLVVLMVVAASNVASGEAYFETLYEMMVEAKDTLKEVAESVNQGLKTVAHTIKFVETFIDSTVEEDCIFKCPRKRIPVRNTNHIPQANGCGSLGMFFEKEDLPRSEMVDCCNHHDLCYDTCGADKDNCDMKFKRCLYSTCDVGREEGNFIAEKKCKGGAKLLYTATMALGCTSFKEAQKEACLCVDAKDIPGTRNEL